MSTISGIVKGGESGALKNIAANLDSSTDMETFSKTIYIHWPSSQFKPSRVINHTTSVFLTMAEIMENVARVENIDFHKFCLVINKDNEDIEVDKSKTLSEYPTDEFILRPSHNPIDHISSNPPSQSVASSRRRSSIMESPGSKITQIRTATEFSVYFQKIYKEDSFDEPNQTDEFISSPYLKEESMETKETRQLETIASQSFDNLSGSKGDETGSNYKLSNEDGKGVKFSSITKLGSNDSLSSLKKATNDGSMSQLMSSQNASATGSALNLKYAAKNNAIVESEIENEMEASSKAIPASIAESTNSVDNVKSRRNRSATLKKAEIRTRVTSEIIGSNAPMPSPGVFEDDFSNNTVSGTDLVKTEIEHKIDSSPLPKILIRVNLPHQMTTTMVKVPESIIMEDLLKYLSARRKFDYEKYTLAIRRNVVVTPNVAASTTPSPAKSATPTSGYGTEKESKGGTFRSNIWNTFKFGGSVNANSSAALLPPPESSAPDSNSSSSSRFTNMSVPISLPPPNVVNPVQPSFDPNLVEVELDRNFLYYRDTMDAKEVIIVPSEKSYSVVCVSENNQDVMLLQMIRGRLQVVAATEAKLIEKLTDDQEHDLTYMNNFLLTFRNFTAPEKVLEILIDRFHVLPPNNPTPEDLEFYSKHKVPTQLKVLDVITWWAEYYWHDFSVSKALRDELSEFIVTASSFGPEYEEKCSKIKDLFDSNMSRYKAIQESKTKSQRNRGKAVNSIFLDIEPEDLARQMSLYCFRLFNHIHSIEFLNQIWGLKAKETDDVDESNNEKSANDLSPNLSYFISRFDLETYWTASEICLERDLKKRTKILKNFILLCEENRNLNNFFSVFSILGGLNLGPVQRLKKTWEGLSARVKGIYDSLEKLSDPSRNMKAIREAILASSPPMVPFLAIYLKDLTFMNDGNKSKIEGMINFAKLRMMGQRVMDLVELNRYSYTFAENAIIMNYLRRPMVEFDLAKLKESSLQCEPKE